MYTPRRLLVQEPTASRQTRPVSCAPFWAPPDRPASLDSSIGAEVVFVRRHALPEPTPNMPLVAHLTYVLRKFLVVYCLRLSVVCTVAQSLVRRLAVGLDLEVRQAGSRTLGLCVHGENSHPHCGRLTIQHEDTKWSRCWTSARMTQPRGTRCGLVWNVTLSIGTRRGILLEHTKQSTQAKNNRCHGKEESPRNHSLQDKFGMYEERSRKSVVMQPTSRLMVPGFWIHRCAYCCTTRGDACREFGYVK